MKNIIATVCLLAATPIIAQSSAIPELPGNMDVSRITGGTYKVDPAHTLVGFTVNHFGFNDYFGLFGNIKGTLTLDRANPENSSVDVTIPVGQVTTASAGLTKHLNSADFFDTANHDKATFKSTTVELDGTDFIITGDLTLRGITKPVTLRGALTGVGANPMNKKETIGFEAGTTIKRSDFGVDYALPAVSDEVELNISAAFEK